MEEREKTDDGREGKGRDDQGDKKKKKDMREQGKESGWLSK